MGRTLKQRIIISGGRWAGNPAARLLRRFATSPLIGQIETTGRKTGLIRRVTVTFAVEGATAWLIAEHGRASGWVNNVLSDPRVRVDVGGRWRSGRAQLVPEDDVRTRAETIARLNGAPAWFLVLGFRALATDPVTVRVDLDPLPPE